MDMEPNNLVRDKTIEGFRKKGASCTFEVLPDIEFHVEVIKSINMRFREGYVISEDPNAAVADLVELIELVYALAKIQGISRHGMKAMVKEQRAENGGYDNKILLKTLVLP